MALVLALVGVLSLGACGGGEEEDAEHRYGEGLVTQVSANLDHAARVAGGADATALAGEGDPGVRRQLLNPG